MKNRFPCNLISISGMISINLSKYHPKFESKILFVLLRCVISKISHLFVQILCFRISVTCHKSSSKEILLNYKFRFLNFLHVELLCDLYEKRFTNDNYSNWIIACIGMHIKIKINVNVVISVMTSNLLSQ